MIWNIILQKRAASFYCLLLILIFNNKSDAQIVYTDIADATPNASYSLDLNNDTIVDFAFYFGGSSGMIGLFCYPQNNNAYSGNFDNGNYLAWALDASYNICDTVSSWYDANNPGTMGLGTSIGYWPAATDKFLALKLIVGTNTYYGWARFDVVATSSSFTIKDYAYESSPNTCILSGQSILGLNEYSNNNRFSIFPNPLISSTTVETSYDLKNASLTLYNAYGQAIKQVNIISGQTISLSRDNLPSGLYLIRLTEENMIIAEDKLLIID
jgi:hypothetical protein